MFGNMAPMELIIIAVVAVVLFGRRLPEVGRTLGKGIVEFKKGIRGLEEEFRFDEHSTTSNAYSPPPFVPSDQADSTVPKFEPPAALTVPKFEPPTTAPVRQPDHPAVPSETV